MATVAGETVVTGSVGGQRVRVLGERRGRWVVGVARRADGTWSMRIVDEVDDLEVTVRPLCGGDDEETQPIALVYTDEDCAEFLAA